MVRIKTEPINVSNTSLSPSVENRHNKFDAKQAKRHDFGKAHCVVCDEVFTKSHPLRKSCSEECHKKRRKAYHRRYKKDNREKINAQQRKRYKENPEKFIARRHKYRKDNPEKELARQRKYRENNREKVNATQRKYRAKKKEE